MGTSDASQSEQTELERLRIRVGQLEAELAGGELGPEESWLELIMKLRTTSTLPVLQYFPNHHPKTL